MSVYLSSVAWFKNFTRFQRKMWSLSCFNFKWRSLGIGQGCDHPETPYVVVISWSMIISGIIVTQETGDSKYVLWYTTDESDDLKFTSVSAEQSASLEVMSRSKGRRATVDIIAITNFFILTNEIMGSMVLDQSQDVKQRLVQFWTSVKLIYTVVFSCYMDNVLM